MVDPNVFEAVNIDPEEYTGFAFGFGIDRVAQLLYGIDHVKNIWDGDVRFAAPESGQKLRRLEQTFWFLLLNGINSGRWTCNAFAR